MKILTLVLSLFFIKSASASDLLDIRLTEIRRDNLKAEILNFDKENQHYNLLKNVKISGRVVDNNKDNFSIKWDKVILDSKDSIISRPFASKIKISNKLTRGDEFSAKGNYSDLIQAIESSLQQKQKEESKPRSNSSSSSGGSSYQGNFSTPYSSRSFLDDNTLSTLNVDDTTSEVEGEIITTTDGCSPYVDYELNQVFVQERTIQDGEELDSCYNSSTSFILEKDYESCADKETENSTEVYFQYFYEDNTNNLDQRYDIGACVLDEALSTALLETITTTEGCSPYVDYELNQVFVQQRVLQGSTVTQSCHNSDTSFLLEKDYDSCPDQQDLELGTNKVYFQYFYEDDSNIKNPIGDCILDETQSGNIEVTKNYDNCTDYIDLSAMKLYKQYQEYYTDNDDNQILLNDCQRDYNKSFNLIENFSKCSLKHYFDEGYSVAQKEIGYNNSENSYEKIYDCFEDENYKYPHYSTSQTCSPIITNGQVQLLERKAITIEGIEQYVTECQPLESINIDDEECSTAPFTHDFEASQSFKNKTYFYYDNNNQKVIISNCIKSDEAFDHFKETSVCNAADDDDTKRTTYYAKTYIEINGEREYIGECQAEETTISYQNIGYKWQNEFTTSSTNLSVVNSKDNIFLGSKQGQEIPDPTYWDYYFQTKIINKYDIGNYTTSGKCDGYSSPSYNGVAIDTSLSSLSSIAINNYIENRSASTICYTRCSVRYTYPRKYCGSSVRICSSGENIHYYQRCTNHQCPLTKIVKFPIYRRSDGSHYIDQLTNLGVKYICGNSSALNGQEVYY